MRYKLPILLVFLLVVVGAMQASAGQLLFQPSTNFPSAGRAYAAGVGDFNSDGRNDVAVTNSAAQLLVYLQDSSGDLAAPVTYDAGSRPESLAVGDLNHDGRDAITTQYDIESRKKMVKRLAGISDRPKKP